MNNLDNYNYEIKVKARECLKFKGCDLENNAHLCIWDKILFNWNDKKVRNIIKNCNSPDEVRSEARKMHRFTSYTVQYSLASGGNYIDIDELKCVLKLRPVYKIKDFNESNGKKIFEINQNYYMVNSNSNEQKMLLLKAYYNDSYNDLFKKDDYDPCKDEIEDFNEWSKKVSYFKIKDGIEGLNATENRYTFIASLDQDNLSIVKLPTELYDDPVKRVEILITNKYNNVFERCDSIDDFFESSSEDEFIDNNIIHWDESSNLTNIISSICSYKNISNITEKASPNDIANNYAIEGINLNNTYVKNNTSLNKNKKVVSIDKKNYIFNNSREEKKDLLKLILRDSTEFENYFKENNEFRKINAEEELECINQYLDEDIKTIDEFCKEEFIFFKLANIDYTSEYLLTQTTNDDSSQSAFGIFLPKVDNAFKNNIFQNNRSLKFERVYDISSFKSSNLTINFRERINHCIVSIKEIRLSDESEELINKDFDTFFYNFFKDNEVQISEALNPIIIKSNDESFRVVKGTDPSADNLIGIKVDDETCYIINNTKEMKKSFIETYLRNNSELESNSNDEITNLKSKLNYIHDLTDEYEFFRFSFVKDENNYGKLLYIHQSDRLSICILVPESIQIEKSSKQEIMSFLKLTKIENIAKLKGKINTFELIELVRYGETYTFVYNDEKSYFIRLDPHKEDLNSFEKFFKNFSINIENLTDLLENEDIQSKESNTNVDTSELQDRQEDNNSNSNVDTSEPQDCQEDNNSNSNVNQITEVNGRVFVPTEKVMMSVNYIDHTASCDYEILNVGDMYYFTEKTMTDLLNFIKYYLCPSEYSDKFVPYLSNGSSTTGLLKSQIINIETISDINNIGYNISFFKLKTASNSSGKYEYFIYSRNGNDLTFLCIEENLTILAGTDLLEFENFNPNIEEFKGTCVKCLTFCDFDNTRSTTENITSISYQTLNSLLSNSINRIPAKSQNNNENNKESNDKCIILGDKNCDGTMYYLKNPNTSSNIISNLSDEIKKIIGKSGIYLAVNEEVIRDIKENSIDFKTIDKNELQGETIKEINEYRCFLDDFIDLIQRGKIQDKDIKNHDISDFVYCCDENSIPYILLSKSDSSDKVYKQHEILNSNELKDSDIIPVSECETSDYERWDKIIQILDNSLS